MEPTERAPRSKSPSSAPASSEVRSWWCGDRAPSWLVARKNLRGGARPQNLRGRVRATSSMSGEAGPSSSYQTTTSGAAAGVRPERRGRRLETVPTAEVVAEGGGAGQDGAAAKTYSAFDPSTWGPVEAPKSLSLSSRGQGREGGADARAGGRRRGGRRGGRRRGGEGARGRGRTRAPSSRSAACGCCRTRRATATRRSRPPARPSPTPWAVRRGTRSGSRSSARSRSLPARRARSPSRTSTASAARTRGRPRRARARAEETRQSGGERRQGGGRRRRRGGRGEEGSSLVGTALRLAGGLAARREPARRRVRARSARPRLRASVLERHRRRRRRRRVRRDRAHGRARPLVRAACRRARAR